MQLPLVSIIVLSWNGWKDTVECLESLYHMEYPRYEIIVLDNGSSDDSVRKIAEYCSGRIVSDSLHIELPISNKPIRVFQYDLDLIMSGGTFGSADEFSSLPGNRKLKIIVSDRNLGYAEGNNVVLRHVLEEIDKPSYVLLLNNDTVVDSKLLKQLVCASESDNAIGFSGPKVYFYDFAGRKDVINFAGGRIVMWKGQAPHFGSGKIDKGEYDELREVDYVEGSCILARTEMIRRIGLLDSRFFAYWEESDWCLRGRRAGFKSVYVPTAMVWHKIDAARNRPRRTYLMTRNMFWFVKKNSDRLQFAAFLLYFFSFSFYLNILGYLIFDRDFGSLSSYFRGAIDGLAGIGETHTE